MRGFDVHPADGYTTVLTGIGRDGTGLEDPCCPQPFVYSSEFLKTSATESGRAEFDEEASRAWSKAAEWHGLEIIKTEGGGPGDDKGVVEFRALYTANGEFCNHHEVAQFEKDADGWRFSDGELVGETPIVREEPKVGRNDLCP